MSGRLALEPTKLMQVCSPRVMAVVVVALDRHVFDRVIDPLDLSMGPRMVHLAQTVFDAMLVADAIEDMLAAVDISLA